MLPRACGRAGSRGIARNAACSGTFHNQAREGLKRGRACRGSSGSLVNVADDGDKGCGPCGSHPIKES